VASYTKAASGYKARNAALHGDPYRSSRDVTHVRVAVLHRHRTSSVSIAAIAPPRIIAAGRAR
jgi:hypothetical protein